MLKLLWYDIFNKIYLAKEFNMSSKKKKKIQIKQIERFESFSGSRKSALTLHFQNSRKLYILMYC